VKYSNLSGGNLLKFALDWFQRALSSWDDVLQSCHSQQTLNLLSKTSLQIRDCYSTSEKAICIIFHSGPTSETPPIMRFAERHCIYCTFSDLRSRYSTSGEDNHYNSAQLLESANHAFWRHYQSLLLQFILYCIYCSVSRVHLDTKLPPQAIIHYFRFIYKKCAGLAPLSTDLWSTISLPSLPQENYRLSAAQLWGLSRLMATPVSSQPQHQCCIGNKRSTLRQYAINQWNRRKNPKNPFRPVQTADVSSWPSRNELLKLGCRIWHLILLVVRYWTLYTEVNLDMSLSFTDLDNLRMTMHFWLRIPYIAWSLPSIV
jgi:hypothetical protein